MRTAHLAKIATLFFLAMGMLFGFPRLAPAQDKLFSLEPALTRATMIKQGNATLRSILAQKETASVRIGKADASLISGGEHELVLDLGGTAPFVAEQQSFKTNADGIGVWRGEVQDRHAKPNYGPNDISVNASNSVILVRHGENITGTIHFDGQAYSVLPLGEGQHAIVNIDESKYPNDGPAVVVKDSQRHIGAGNDKAAGDNQSGKTAADRQSTKSKIRVLMIVSNQAALKIQDIQAFATLAIEDANQGFANSGIQIEFENAGVFHLNYDETGTYGNLLSQLANPSNPALGAPVHKLREEHAADVATLFVDHGAYCGMAYLSANKGNAYSVVTWHCAVGNHTFAHEIGHNLGAEHDGTGGRFPYGHGYQQRNATPRWRTVMAYDCSPACPKVNA